jgi:AcrR family transcriptional regulator
MEPTATEYEGLRERKKRQTRAAIAAAAMRLFRERGFDAVTIADVARAADVSEKTIFNYFPAKEDLVFRAGGERRAAIIQAIRDRAAGESFVAPFRAATMAFLDHVARDPVEETVAIPRLVAGSTALRNRLFLGWEEESAVLGPVLAEEAGEPADDLAAFRRLLAGEDQRAVAADLRAQADRAYDLLEAGLAGYGVRDA